MKSGSISGPNVCVTSCMPCPTVGNAQHTRTISHCEVVIINYC